MYYGQIEYDIRCEWGLQGALTLGPISDVMIIVDVLSFSTAVDVATHQGAVVYPYRWKDDSAYSFAESIAAVVADGRNAHGYRLSPSSLRSLPSQTRLVLASPNGAEISLAAGQTSTFAGCLRNSLAVAEAAAGKGRRIAVIPAGERWADGSLRPCLEDLIGAGAIIRRLSESRSPEASMAVTAFESAASKLFENLKACSSGKEKAGRGEEADLILAADLDVSDCPPILIEGAFRKMTVQ
jgi:2-phosphosulfolactate phosphatase